MYTYYESEIYDTLDGTYRKKIVEALNRDHAELKIRATMEMHEIIIYLQEV